MKKVLSLFLLSINLTYPVGYSETKGVEAEEVVIQFSDSSPILLIPKQVANQAGLFRDLGFDESINLHGLAPASDQVFKLVMQWLMGQKIIWGNLSGYELVDTISLMTYLQIDLSSLLFDLVQALRPKLSRSVLEHAIKKIPGGLYLPLIRPVPEVVSRRDYYIPTDGLKWSPDGYKVAVNFDKSDRTGRWTQIYSAEEAGYRAIGPEIRGIADEWSPDSQILSIRQSPTGGLYRIVDNTIVRLEVPDFDLPIGNKYQFCGWSPVENKVVQCYMASNYGMPGSSKNRILQIDEANQVIPLSGFFSGYPVKFSPDGTKILVYLQTVDWIRNNQARNLIFVYQISNQSVDLLIESVEGEQAGWSLDGSMFWAATKGANDNEILSLYGLQTNGRWQLVDQKTVYRVQNQVDHSDLVTVSTLGGVSLFKMEMTGWKVLDGNLPYGDVAGCGVDRFVSCAFNTELRAKICQLYQVNDRVLSVGAPFIVPPNNYFKIYQNKWLFFSSYNQRNTRLPVLVYQLADQGLSLVDHMMLQSAWSWVPNQAEIYGPTTFVNYRNQLEFVRPNPLGLMVRNLFDDFDKAKFYDLQPQIPLVQQFLLTYLADQFEAGRLNLADLFESESLSSVFQKLPVDLQTYLNGIMQLPGQVIEPVASIVNAPTTSQLVGDTEINLEQIPEVPAARTCTSWFCNLFRRWRN